MTRRRKWLIGGSGGLLAFSLLVVGPWPLDRTPDQQPEREALEIVARKGAELQQAHQEQGPMPLLAGWAVEPFSLPEGVPLAGYGARRGASSEGYLYEQTLSARTVVLRTSTAENSAAGGVAIVCADLLLVNAPIADAVTARVVAILGARAPTLMFTATHTHSGPGGWGDSALEELIAGDHDPAVIDELVGAISQSIVAAVENLEPASYAWIETAAPEFLRNRSVPGGEVDATLEALVLRRKSQRESGAAILALFGAHATCLSDDNLQLSGDYPGSVVDFLEAEQEIEFAAFAAGCVGSHSPVVNEVSQKLRGVQLGANLAVLLMRQLEAAEFRSEVRLSASEFRLPTPDLQLRVGASLRLSPVATGLIHAPRAEVVAMRLDERLWIGVPFEVSGLLSAALREGARDSGLAGLTMSSFQGDYLGYLIPDRLYEAGKVYEAQMSFLGPRGGSYFQGLIRSFIATQKPARYDFEPL